MKYVLYFFLILANPVAKATDVMTQKLLLKQSYSTSLYPSDLRSCSLPVVTRGEPDYIDHSIHLRHQVDHVTEENIRVILRTFNQFNEPSDCENFKQYLSGRIQEHGGLNTYYTATEYLITKKGVENGSPFCRQEYLTLFEMNLFSVNYYGSYKESLNSDYNDCIKENFSNF